MLAKFIITSAALALGVTALQVTAPTNATGWTTDGAQVIKWDSVVTDPSNFTIQVIDPASPNSPVTIAEEVETSDGEYTWTPPSALAAGNQWRVNFVSEGAGILAQSNYFEVEQGQSTVSASASASAGSSSASTASSTVSQSPSASQNPSASASSSAQPTGAASRMVAPGGMILALAGFVGFFA